MAAFLKINDVEIPTPARGLEFIDSVVVDAGRNANGTVVGQKIGRTLHKVNNLKWNALKDEDWKKIKKAIEPFFVSVEIPDVTNGGTMVLKMYTSDVKQIPYFLDEKDPSKVTLWEECSFNLIDVGEPM